MKYGKSGMFNPRKSHDLNINNQAVSRVLSGSLVLEIGCATGYIGKYLIKNKNCKIIGIEISEAEAKKAKRVLTRVYVGNVEDDRLIKKVSRFGKFDYIYSTELIEHLVNPWRALGTWKKFLKKEGKLVISTPNIAHWSTRRNILFGNFDYTDYGILDNNHLHFFTEKSFKELVESSGYEIIDYSIDSVGGGYPRISKLLSRFFPNLFAYQMLIYAKLK